MRSVNTYFEVNVLHEDRFKAFLGNYSMLNINLTYNTNKEDII